MNTELLFNGARCSVELTRSAVEPSHVVAAIKGRQVEADVVKITPKVYSILLGGRSLEVCVEELADGLLLQTTGRAYRVEIVQPRYWRRIRSGGIDLASRQQIFAPLAGQF